MPAPAPADQSTYDYAYIRLTPRVETGEFINVGVILFCRVKNFLDAAIVFDPAQAVALAPHLDIELTRGQLELIPAICRGAGPIGQLECAEIFHWLTAPHSTVIQTSPVHSGLCNDPAATLEKLAADLHGGVKNRHVSSLGDRHARQ